MAGHTQSGLRVRGLLASTVVLTTLLIAWNSPSAMAGGWPMYEHESWTPVEVPGAKCGDGSDFRFFISRSEKTPNTDRVVVWFPGGGSTGYKLDGTLNSPIKTLTDLANRLTAPERVAMTVSSPAPFMDHPANDPFVGNAHWVIMPYCTQDFHSGNRSDIATYDFSGEPLEGAIEDAVETSPRCDPDTTLDQIEAFLEERYPSLDIVEATGDCSAYDIHIVNVGIAHQGAVNVRAALPILRSELVKIGVDPREPSIVVAGSSAGGFSAWYNGRLFGDELYASADLAKAQLSLVPMSGSPTTKIWNDDTGELVESQAELEEMEYRLAQHQVTLPCEVAGGVYDPQVDPDECHDTLDLADHYGDRYPGLDLRIAPVINKEDKLGVTGFAGQPDDELYGPKLLQFCQTVHRYGERIVEEPSLRSFVHPWIAWQWATDNGVESNADRVHGMKLASQLAPLASPGGDDGYEAGDGMHGILDFINDVAMRDSSLAGPPNIDYNVGLVEDFDDQSSGLDEWDAGDGWSDWNDARLETPAPAGCNV